MTQTMQNNIKPFINRRKLLLSYKNLRLENARTLDAGERLQELLDELEQKIISTDAKTVIDRKKLHENIAALD